LRKEEIKQWQGRRTTLTGVGTKAISLESREARNEAGSQLLKKNGVNGTGPPVNFYGKGERENGTGTVPTNGGRRSQGAKWSQQCRG